MGNFYTNITLKGPAQEQIAGYLNEIKRVTYVSPTMNNFTVVYDEESENQYEIDLGIISKELSKKFKCPAFAVLCHDDDVLFYHLYNDGVLLDEYNSAPGFFENGEGEVEPGGGNSQQVCEVFGKQDIVDQLEVVLRKPSFSDDGYIFASDRHCDIVNLLEIPEFSIATGFNYIEEEEVPEGLDNCKLIKTGSSVSV